ncbi:hypothetical protein GCM10009118_27750 [Wandonia haliotis]|uniref:DUF4136 domain-containing protein n=2 Tax=Wandonia haliotis TaxID=574963 RepID=A0ABN1MSX3_9FLAO
MLLLTIINLVLTHKQINRPSFAEKRRMKRILILGFVAAVLVSCSGIRYKMTLTEDELSKFSYDKEYIYYNSEKVAKFGYIEYEYDRGYKVLEISFEQLRPGLDDFTDKIVEFIRYKNPNAKVEVKIPQFPFENEIGNEKGE